MNILTAHGKMNKDKQFSFLSKFLEIGKMCPLTTGDLQSTDCTGVGMLCNLDSHVCECDYINGWHYNGMSCSQGTHSDITGIFQKVVV